MLKGEDFFKDKNDEFSGGSSSSFSPRSSERVPMIEKIFKLVLDRKPSSRELAYYKYGVLKEEDIYIKLIKSDEHKRMLEQAKKLPNIEDELKDLRITERKLVQSRDDIKEELISLQTLLEEKSSIIKELREKISNPYDLPSEIEKYEEGFDVYSSKRGNLGNESKRTFKDIFKDLINLFFK